jgi:hypothetical protein
MWRLSRYCLGFARLEYHYSAGLSRQRLTFYPVGIAHNCMAIPTYALGGGIERRLEMPSCAADPGKPLCLDVSGRNTAGFLMKMASEITSARARLARARSCRPDGSEHLFKGTTNT